ncbi:MAG TPA: glucose-6-phosphate isomerase [Candidatus Saccharimonadales bacterium]|nr:glucose-6-phosphate isomerase [Candidatus Saccharimonadales bacterium]
MHFTNTQLWERFQKHLRVYPSLGLSLDISRLNFPEDFFTRLQAPMENAFREMEQLEKGAIANTDENRMVGHYWLRNPSLAPNEELKNAIEHTVAEIKLFTAAVQNGNVTGSAGPFKNLLLIGIGGSALGPQFVAAALTSPAKDKLKPFFFDNTDPDGMRKVLSEIGSELGRTLCVVVSKSGGTKETRNGMLEAQVAYKNLGVDFSKHAVAVTGEGSQLDVYAQTQKWLRRFPMWDWVGGRTSETSAVGLLPAALQGFDVDAFLAGARDCDLITRDWNLDKNPAARMAAAWFYAGEGRGSKDMVVLPYKDRLELFSRYLQQLIMESLGKEKDRDGKVVHQGLAVYGNKGSTDQHAYVQQLKEGIDNFFVTFIRVLKDQEGSPLLVEPGVTSGDYLDGFFQGTRQALYENGRESLTLTLDAVSPRSIGILIALFERSVGFYASLINVNAYHQPGVEAGKKAAGVIIAIQEKLLGFFTANKGKRCKPHDLAEALGLQDEQESILHICEHLAANGRLNSGPDGTYFS